MLNQRRYFAKVALMSLMPPETAYLSCLADIKRHDNEKVMLAIREQEMNLQVQEKERTSAEKKPALSWI
jgi:hypothetical protein